MILVGPKSKGKTTSLQILYAVFDTKAPKFIVPHL